MSEHDICQSLDGSQTEFPVETIVAGHHFIDADLHALGTNQLVRVLDLTESKITDDGFNRQVSLPSLERLYLTSIVRMTDRGLSSVCKCASLKELCILDTSMTDEGLHHILSLPQLECLRLGSDGMDGSGLVHLHSHPKLRCLALDIHCSDESRGFVDSLQATRPNLVINW